MAAAPTFSLRKLRSISYMTIRYYAAFTLMSYGFAKVMGAQFTVLDSQLAKPMGDVSGFWLTWYYFGYSATYSALVAWAQIVGAMLLCFRRTSLIGAFVLLPVIINIVGIDLWVVQFPVNSGALRNAVLVLIAIVGVICFHARDLYRFSLQRRGDLAILVRNRPWTVGLQALIIAGMIAYTAHEGYWLANVNNRAPTAIDGAWHIVQSRPATANQPEWLYFEYNRAYMVVFSSANGNAETHDFRVDEAAKKLMISEEWLTPGSDIFEGSWERTGDTMTVHGIWKGSPVDLVLQRKPMHVKDHR